MLALARYALSAVAAVYFSALAGLTAFQRTLLYHPGGRIIAPVEAGLVQAREIRLKTKDGETLIAWRMDPQPGRPLILYFHGKGGVLADRVKRFRLFAESGYGLLAVSYRGYGGSTGAPTQDGILQDAETAYAEALRLGYAPPQIVLMGESLGTGVATIMASRHEAAALVLDSAYASALDVAAERYPLFPVGLVMLDPFRSDLSIAKVHMPLLMTHGEADQVIPIASAKKLFDLANEPKTFIALPGRQHVVLGGDTIYPRVRAWIDAATEGR